MLQYALDVFEVERLIEAVVPALQLPQETHQVLAGALTGILYKSTASWKACGLAGVMGGLTMTAYNLYKREYPHSPLSRLM